MLHIDLCIRLIYKYIAQIAYCTSNILSGLSTQTQTQKHISKKNKSFSKEFKQNNIVTVCRGGGASTIYSVPGILFVINRERIFIYTM